MGVYWADGRLAAKQLFDALNHCGIDPKKCEFCNIFETGGRTKAKKFKGSVVAMGNKVQKELNKLKVSHLCIVHPAARGKIRKKWKYCRHVKRRLGKLLKVA